MIKGLFAFVLGSVGAGVLAMLAAPQLGVAFVLSGIAISWHLLAALGGGLTLASMVK